MLWTDKYKPINSNDLVGDPKKIKKVVEFISNYSKQKKKALLLYGASGTGKSCFTYAIAKELNLEVMELSAADYRDKESILNILGTSSKQASLFYKGKVILIDEIDGISGRKDYGGINAIISVLQDSSFPIIITADDPFDSKFSSLRSKCELIELDKIDYLEQFKVLKKICENEKLGYEEEILKTIARRNSGDLRSSINDLQSLYCGRVSLIKEDLEDISYRERTEELENVLRVIFKSSSLSDVTKIVDNNDLDLDELFLWVENNVPAEYNVNDLNDAYDKLSLSNVFKGRIIKRQYWRFLVYQKFLMTSGVALAKKEKKQGMVSYKRNDRILKIWLNKRKYAYRDEIINKAVEELKISKKKANQEYPYIKNII